jgi:hypothetical protein
MKATPESEATCESPPIEPYQRRGDFKSVIAPVPQSNREVIPNAIQARRKAMLGGDREY